MICDVCNAPTTKEIGILVSPVRFRALLAKGFGIHESNIRLLTESGMSRKDAIFLLGSQHASSESFWLLCPECAAQAEQLL